MKIEYPNLVNQLRRSDSIVLGLVALSLVGCSNDSSNVSTNRSSGANASALVAAKDPLSLPDGVIGTDSLMAYAKAAGQPKTDDQFAKPFNDTSLTGRSFKVTVPYTKYNSSFKYYYDSDKEKLTFSVRLNSTYHDDYESDPKLDFAILQQDAIYGTPTPMSNAFGLTKDVTPVSQTTVGLGNLRDTYVGIFPKDSMSSASYIFYKGLSKEISIHPEGGREAVEGLELDLEGVITAKNKHSIICKKSESKAKIDYPYETKYDECVVLVKFTRIALHSPKLGTILEMTAPPTKPPGKDKH